MRDILRPAAGWSLGIVLFLSPLFARHGGAATWTPLKNLAPDYTGTMMLLTDGTVMVEDNDNVQSWFRLTPDKNGSYINGTWTANPIADMKIPRLYFASQVLPDGRVWVVGGEYSGPFFDGNDAPSGEIWDPVSNKWSLIEHYPNEVGGCGPKTVTSNVSETTKSNVLSGIYSTDRFQVGWTVTGNGIPAGATVTSVDSATQVHISAAATSTSVSTLQFYGPALACFGDDPSILLSSNKVLAGNIFNNSTYSYDVATNTWELQAYKVYEDPSDEEGWTKLPGGLVLNYDLFQSIFTGNGYAELYNPATNQWSSVSPVDGTAKGFLPLLSDTQVGYELGPILRMQDGRSIVIGANQHTALYTPSTNTWAAGPDMLASLSSAFGTLPNMAFGADDAPAALLPNGHVILAADAGPSPVNLEGKSTANSAVIKVASTAGLQVYWSVAQADGNSNIIQGGSYIVSVDSPTQVTISQAALGGTSLPLVFGGIFSNPTRLFDFDPATNSLSPVSPALDDANLPEISAYVTRMLILPTGQLLFVDSSQQLWVYTPDGEPAPEYRPAVTKVTYDGAGIFTLTGKQLTGVSDGSAYGDDVQSDENYPIVRLTNAAGEVYYCRTTNWSTTSVATGSTPVTVNFTLHPDMKPGNYSLVVSAAGVASFPLIVNITQAEVSGR